VTIPNFSELTTFVDETLAAMSGLEQMSFYIFLAMTITFFGWLLYLIVSP